MIYGRSNFSAYSKGKGKSFYKKREKKDKRVNVKRSYESFWQGSLPDLVWNTGCQMGINIVTINHFYHPALLGCSSSQQFHAFIVSSLLLFWWRHMSQERGPVVFGDHSKVHIFWNSLTMYICEWLNVDLKVYIKS